MSRVAPCSVSPHQATCSQQPAQPPGQATPYSQRPLIFQWASPTLPHLRITTRLHTGSSCEARRFSNSGQPLHLASVVNAHQVQSTCRPCGTRGYTKTFATPSSPGLGVWFGIPLYPLIEHGTVRLYLLLMPSLAWVRFQWPRRNSKSHVRTTRPSARSKSRRTQQDCRTKMTADPQSQNNSLVSGGLMLRRERLR